MTDPEPIDVQVSLDTAEIRIGEVLRGDGQTEPQVWLTGKGRRQLADDEPVNVNLFMSIEESKEMGTDLIGQAAVLEATLQQPEFPAETPGEEHP